MNKIRTLLVDDEFLALRLLEDFASRVPVLELIDKVKSPAHAIEIIQSGKIDLLFLDIHMPVISGTQFLRSLKNPPVTIFTTAYSEYALEAFDLGASDYLLKPFSFDRFLQAVTKAIDHIRYKRNEFEPNGNQESMDTLTIKADGKMHRIAYNEILFIEGLKEYVKIVTRDKTYITLETFKNLEQILPSPQFLRVHKSYMVAKDKVRSVQGHMLEINKIQIPMSREKKEELVKLIFNL